MLCQLLRGHKSPDNIKLAAEFHWAPAMSRHSDWHVPYIFSFDSSQQPGEGFWVWGLWPEQDEELVSEGNTRI